MTDVYDVFELNTEPEPLPSRKSRRAHHGRRRASVGSIIVGVFGELLITAGLIIGLFVVWQVYWTDVIGAREAAGHIEVFEQSLPPVPDTVAPEQTGDAPVASVKEGSIGVLYVPRWGEDYRMPITDGVGLDVLNDGYVGHYPETQVPGELGNFALAGHRQTHGKPFRYVEELKEGDPLIVQTKDAFYVYRVSSHEIVKPTDTRVIAANPFDPGAAPEQQLLTLTTCHPLWSIKERWIVHAELDYWTDLSDGRPADLPEGSL
ncbi:MULTISPECIES: class E sortase [unclassified Pseudactinotalea]|uniref:class E sortase n=1 Tax=unclassified Pseudactinotalea TaxID=2649176 RepID=UPI00128E4EAE|nr:MULTISPECIES: class E sortase [unclassified Pseudactinotalea]MPV49193.1 class E sortase [Pseudactinotalea sp. HY160]QGH68134.1 class E sortase [Pseudactinotalea sp. HY158]